MYIQQLFEQCYVRLKDCSKCNVKIRNLSANFHASAEKQRITEYPEEFV